MNKKRISALLLTGIITLSMGTGVFAEEKNMPPSVDEGGKVSITKNFEMAEGLAIPQNASFSFVAESKQVDAPQATIRPIIYSETDKKPESMKEGKYTLSKNTSLSFGEFPHAGVYEYVVKENTGNLEGVDYSKAEYTLRVYVKNDSNSPNKLSIHTITASGNTGKTDKVLFTNTYTKDATLEIEKKTEGEYADKTKMFQFKITFVKSPMSDQTVFVGKIGEKTVSCTAGTATEFELCDGQKLVFEKLPVGTRYVVEEIAAADGYTPQVNVIENAEETVQNKTAQEAEGLTSSKDGTTNNLVGEKENKVTFTNTYKNIPITGMFINNVPFIVIIGVAFVVLIALSGIKKLRASRR